MNIFHNRKTHSLPSLNGLRGFEAVAKYLSFTDAARELNVTQTAVSHQIKSLEDQLGLKLFNRSGKSISLTKAGEKLLPVTTESFDALENVVHQIKVDNQIPILTVSVTPSFASKWLVQRLGRFWRAHPDIQLNLHHSLELANFTTDNVDIAIRGGKGNWSGLTSELLLPLDLSPICHPSLLTGKYPLINPSDLKHHTLLHEDNYEDWTIWLRAAGVGNVDPRSGNIMNDSNSLGIAVENCQGVALGRLSLIQSDLESENIIQPFDISIKSNFSYYLVYPQQKLTSPSVRAFREFILNEVC